MTRMFVYLWSLLRSAVFRAILSVVPVICVASFENVLCEARLLLLGQGAEG